MTGLTILNPAYRRDNLAPFFVLDDVFSVEELDEIERYCGELGVEKAMVMQSRGVLVSDEKLRKSYIRHHSVSPDNRWIFERVVETFEQANRDAFNFILDGFNTFQYSEYRDEGSHYEYHMDLSFASTSEREVIGRKLSLSVMLGEQSEFTGGAFEVVIDSQTLERPLTVPHRRGRFVFFPSFVMHRVAPVTGGTRRSLVFWALGPKFR